MVCGEYRSVGAVLVECAFMGTKDSRLIAGYVKMGMMRTIRVLGYVSFARGGGQDDGQRGQPCRLHGDAVDGDADRRERAR